MELTLSFQKDIPFNRFMNFQIPYFCDMIRISGLEKSFGKLKVLQGVEMFVNKKEIVSVVGASGSGKSTLLQIIGTLDKADSGQLAINQVDVSTLSEKKLASFRNQFIGFVFQFHHLLPEFTALENVCIPAFIAGKGKREAESKAKEILFFLNLEKRMSHKPAQLSGGEQQRVAIARALINDPAVVLADEPSGNLDEQSTEELHRLFFRLREELEQTFIIATHDKELAKQTDRILQLKDGKLNETPSL